MSNTLLNHCIRILHLWENYSMAHMTIEEGESQFGDEDPDQSNEEQEEDSGEESEVGMELDEPGLGDIIDPDQDFDMEVCHSSIC